MSEGYLDMFTYQGNGNAVDFGKYFIHGTDLRGNSVYIGTKTGKVYSPQEAMNWLLKHGVSTEGFLRWNNGRLSSSTDTYNKAQEIRKNSNQHKLDVAKSFVAEVRKKIGLGSTLDVSTQEAPQHYTTYTPNPRKSLGKGSTNGSPISTINGGIDPVVVVNNQSTEENSSETGNTKEQTGNTSQSTESQNDPSSITTPPTNTYEQLVQANTNAFNNGINSAYWRRNFRKNFNSALKNGTMYDFRNPNGNGNLVFDIQGLNAEDIMQNPTWFSDKKGLTRRGMRAIRKQMQSGGKGGYQQAANQFLNHGLIPMQPVSLPDGFAPVELIPPTNVNPGLDFSGETNIYNLRDNSFSNPGNNDATKRGGYN